MRKATRVCVLGGYRLELAFDDGTEGTVDLSVLASIPATCNPPILYC